MDFNKTSVFNVAELRQELILIMLNEVIEALEFKGYNPTNQIVGYLISGDLGYISSYQDARSKIKTIDRSKIVEVLVTSFLNK